MVEIDHPEIDAEAVLARVRAVEARTSRPQQAPPSPVSAPPPAASLVSPELERHLEALRRTWNVGETLPPMSRRSGLVRMLAEPAARAVLRVAQLITRDQRSFNAESLGALESVKALVAEQRAELESVRAELAATRAELAQVGTEARAARGWVTELGGRLDKQAAGLAALEPKVAGAVQESGKARTQVAQQELALQRLVERASGAGGGAQVLAAVSQHVGEVQDRGYSNLEDRFRGPRETVKQRAAEYLPLLRQAGLGTEAAPVLDLGCGRGEWLELLKEQGLHGRGIDFNSSAVDFCTGIGLAVERGDAMEVLRRLPDGSIGAVSAIHVVEHLPPAQIQALTAEVVRVLRPGGMVLYETPNPRNLFVGACSFYIDPTHVRPVHPDWLALVLEVSGLHRLKLLFARPDPRYRTEPLADPVQAGVNEMLFGPQDYAAIGYRP